MSDNDFIKRLTDSSSLTDVLIQMESFLDDLDIYVFKNWFEGVVVEGPHVERYWVSMKLRYEYDEMPDPTGGLRLMKYGARISYQLKSEDVVEITDTPMEIMTKNPPSASSGSANRKPNVNTEEKVVKYWVIDISIPRHFIEELDDSDLDIHTKELDDISDARDADLSDEDAYRTDQSDDEAEDDMDTDEEEV